MFFSLCQLLVLEFFCSLHSFFFFGFQFAFFEYLVIDSIGMRLIIEKSKLVKRFLFQL